jgi:hypothetical protein
MEHGRALMEQYGPLELIALANSQVLNMHEKKHGLSIKFRFYTDGQKAGIVSFFATMNLA